MAVCDDRQPPNNPQQVMDPVEAEKKHHHHHKHQEPDDGDGRRKDPKEGWLLPRLEFTANDLGCAGSCKFMGCGINCHALLHDAMVAVLRRLYLSPEHQPRHQKTVALILRPMSGVAYTTGSGRHKEIHLSTDYIDDVDKERLKDEIEGVVRHEMVHVWQHNGNGTAPGGLIEGIADWVRLKDGFIPPHWSRGGDSWDDGYQNTAYFLDWLEDTYGAGTVVGINRQLKDHDYCDDMWVQLSGGKSVHELWDMYCHRYGLQPTAGGGRAMDEAASSAMDVKPIPVYHAAPPPPSRTEILVDQETEPVAPGSPPPPPPSLPGTTDSESSYNPFPFRGESALGEVFTERLKKLTFDGERDGRRFVKEFEALVGRVNPEMGDDDKRLLLTTCFVGSEVNFWYEEADLDDDMPYGLLVEQLQQRFKGKSNRKTALIDRDAKLS